MLAATSELQEQVTRDLTLSYGGAVPIPEIITEAYGVPGMSVLASIATWEGNEKRGTAEGACQPPTPHPSSEPVEPGCCPSEEGCGLGTLPTLPLLRPGWVAVHLQCRTRKGPLGQGLA